LRDLFNASLCEVLDEHGNKTQFGDLVSGKRTIVVFIRHCESFALAEKTLIDVF
jgi:hypothetical protein